MLGRLPLDNEAALGVAAAVEAVLVRGAGKGPGVCTGVHTLVALAAQAFGDPRARRVVALERQTGRHPPAATLAARGLLRIVL